MELITDQHPELLPVEVIGGKAHGLYRIKSLEKILSEEISTTNYPNKVVVPKFFVVPVGYQLDDQILAFAERLGAESFAVRSSSPFEDGTDNSFDGCFESVLNVNQDSLFEAIKYVRASALGERAMKYARDFGLNIDQRMGVIVQEMAPSITTGVIYSKAPALINARKIEVSSSVEHREIFIRGKGAVGRIIVGSRDYLRTMDCCDGLAQVLESAWGCPVRIEFTNCQDVFYLLQCRPLTSPDQTQFSFTDKDKSFQLIAETNDVNMPADVYYPLVNIINRESAENIGFEEVAELDRRFAGGYILMCAYLKFWHNDYDDVTLNKKGVIVTADCLISHPNDHNADICRKRGIPYLKMWCLNQLMEEGELDLKTGDMVRIKSDGITAQFYKEA